MQCSWCGATEVRRSRARFRVERVLSRKLHIYAYRCALCKARFRRWEPARARNGAVFRLPGFLKELSWIVLGTVLVLVLLIWTIHFFERR